jgi:hypothetical protein
LGLDLLTVTRRLDELVAGGGQPIGRPGRDDDVATCVEEALGDSEADALAATGDDGPLAR